MMGKWVHKVVMGSALLILSSAAFSAADWKIISKDSSLVFSATQNDAPVKGTFQRFTGKIQFDPADLKSSHIEIAVDLTSVKTGDSQVADTLKSADWFNTGAFPKAVFKAASFVKTGDKTYQANGTLTLRDKTQPLVLNFILKNYSDSKALATGSAIIKRTQFGVGQGDWSKTDAIKDDVQVEFMLSATK
jgi:polyisoprenoid-binding protein YceI